LASALDRLQQPISAVIVYHQPSSKQERIQPFAMDALKLIPVTSAPPIVRGGHVAVDNLHVPEFCDRQREERRDLLVGVLGQYLLIDLACEGFALLRGKGRPDTFEQLAPAHFNFGVMQRVAQIRGLLVSRAEALLLFPLAEKRA
jgi:hypothetical protein